MEDEIKVVICPYCGDMWELKDDLPPAVCECFRCRNYYVLPEVKIMWRWVFDLCKKVKG